LNDNMKKVEGNKTALVARFAVPKILGASA
jgi:hypothetical protein